MTDAPNADEREGAVVSVSAGSLPSLSGSGAVAGDEGKQEVAVRYVDPADWRAADDVEKARLATPLWPEARNSFRHIQHMSGAPVAVFTAYIHGGGGLTAVGGGRAGPLQPGDPRAGYIAQGFDCFAVAGGAPGVYGIPVCTGPFCY